MLSEGTTGNGATMQYVEKMLSATGMLELVHEMRMKGYNVERTPLRIYLPRRNEARQHLRLDGADRFFAG